MITIKLLGGAKKSFTTDKITVNADNLTINEVLVYLQENKPKDTPTLDVDNLLIAINGVDSSALEGNLTKLKNDDIVSIIPIIHGGSSKRVHFRVNQSKIELFAIKGSRQIDEKFLIQLREKFPSLKIQGVSSRFVLNESHAKKILTISFAAKKKNILLAKKIETDILMRFAGSTQIELAIKKVGIKKGLNFILIAIGRKASLDKLYKYLKPISDDSTFLQNNTSFLKKEFTISQKQMKCIVSNSPLEDLLVEKAAILI